MAVRLRKQNFRLNHVATGVLVVGASFLVFKTFPHLKTSITSCIFGARADDVTEDENSPVEVSEHAEGQQSPSDGEQIQSLDNIAQWSVDSLKSYLIEVCVFMNLLLIDDDTNNVRRTLALLQMPHMRTL